MTNRAPTDIILFFFFQLYNDTVKANAVFPRAKSSRVYIIHRMSSRFIHFYVHLNFNVVLPFTSHKYKSSLHDSL